MKKFIVPFLFSFSVLAGPTPTPVGQGGGSSSGGTTTTNLSAGLGIVITTSGVTNNVKIDTNTVAQKSDLLTITNLLNALPATRVISPYPPLSGSTGNTNWFGPWTTGTKSAGFNEAGLSLLGGATNLPGGQKIYVMPGLYDIGEPITNILRQGTMELTYEGAGNLQSMIRQTNSIPMPAFRFNALGSTNYLNFNLVHLGVFSVTNACTNLTEFIGYTDAGLNFRGAIGGGRIEDCYMDCWLYATNTTTTGMATDQFALGGKKNLCFVYMNNNFGGQFDIFNNKFNNGMIWIANDNTTFYHNQMIGYGGRPNDWAITDPRASGCGVIFIDPSFAANNIHIWDVGDNHFVGNGAPYLIMANGYRRDFPIHDDNYEGSAVVTPVTISTTNFNVTFKDCYSDFDQVFTNNRVVISTSDYTSSASYAYTTNSIYRLNTTHGMSEYRFNATNSFNVFAGNGAGLTSLTAANISTNTVTVVATNWVTGILVPAGVRNGTNMFYQLFSTNHP